MPAVSIQYIIRHQTRFRYAAPAHESVIECRMRPAGEGLQRCLQFELDVQPAARVFAFRDFAGNWVHHFNLPRAHTELLVAARSQVEVEVPPTPPSALPHDAWHTIDEWNSHDQHWDFVQPSQFAVWSPTLLHFEHSIGLEDRQLDPLTTARGIMNAIHGVFEYVPKSTRVDSPIEDALTTRRGVCQDFAHVMLALLRRRGLPSRYVSGYVAPGKTDDATRGASATHAWVEVLLPELGWLGLDPTHNVDAGIRHVRVAVGRDYADVPPTRGTFKGGAAGELSVSVTIDTADRAPSDAAMELWTAWPASSLEVGADRQAQQRQQ